MDVNVDGNSAEINGRTMRCAIGRSGFKQNKKEGDGTTPIGRFPLREVFYREDRISKPSCVLPVRAVTPTDGWCDDPADPNYNRLVSLPYTASHENLWREDFLYDLLIVIGYNDAPPIPGAGSAIFMHVARDDYSPTQGCIALKLDDLQFVIGQLTENSHVNIVAT
jgi:L,D-peptidoglycan transpeptidase YkuD (ErfK/YbiS/YcfS/YnhG family)